MRACARLYTVSLTVSLTVFKQWRQSRYMHLGAHLSLAKLEQRYRAALQRQRERIRSTTLFH